MHLFHKACLTLVEKQTEGKCRTTRPASSKATLSQIIAGSETPNKTDLGLEVGIALVRLTGCTLSIHRRRKSKSGQMDR